VGEVECNMTWGGIGKHHINVADTKWGKKNKKGGIVRGQLDTDPDPTRGTDMGKKKEARSS